MTDVTRHLPLPDEPVEARAAVRASLDESPEEGARLIGEATFVADPLWERWAETLEGAGMDRERFLEVSRGYAGEIRLWVVGERVWEHCAAGLAGRAWRRLDARRREAIEASDGHENLACSGVSK